MPERGANEQNNQQQHNKKQSKTKQQKKKTSRLSNLDVSEFMVENNIKSETEIFQSFS